MRLWKKISIYFIYPACMLAAGLAAGLGVQEFFYPNRFPPRRGADKRTGKSGGAGGGRTGTG